MTHYRNLSTAGLKAVQIDRTTQAVPQLHWVRVEDLVIDPAYQRDIQQRGRQQIQRIAEAFDWTKFACVVVAPVEGGKYALIDGQHRATAAQLVGLETIPAQVIVADQRTQAAAFQAINSDITRINALQVHLAAVAAGDPLALEVVDVCRCADVEIARSVGGANKQYVGLTAAVKALREGLEKYGRDTVITALQCVTLSNNNLPGLLQAHVVRGLCIVMGRSPLWREAGERLFKAMDEINLEDISQATCSRAPRLAANDFSARLDVELRRLLGPPAPVEQTGQLVELCQVSDEALNAALPRRRKAMSVDAVS